MERADIVMFIRTLNNRSAGGARAVVQRANLFAELGHRVVLAVTGMSSDVEVARMRRVGDLHPEVRLQHLWSDGPGWCDHLRAAEQLPIDPPRPDEQAPGTRREVLDTGRSRIVRTFVDGVLRSEEVLAADGSITRSFRLHGEDGECVQHWRYQDGRLVLVDDMIDNLPALRRFYLDGRYCWLTADIRGVAGTGRAEQPTAADDDRTDFAGAIARWLDREFADSEQLVVFADGENVWQRAVRSMRHPGVRGVSVLHNSHLDAPFDAGAGTKPEWEPYFADTTNIEVMVCLTARQQDHLHRRYPGLPLRVVHHPAPTPPRPVRTESARPRKMIFLGRLAEQKRLDHLVAVLERVATRVPDVTLEVYGRGTGEHEFSDALRERGLIDRVIFRGFTHDALSAFAGARVAVMTSWYEGLPLTLTEAMSVGTPWVAYDLNYGPAEVIRDGLDGYLVPPGDIDRFAARVSRLLTDDDLARRMSTAAREVSARFTRERYRREWLEVLHTALGSGRRAVDAELVGSL